MKSILISIKPKHCANILNGLKTIEIRKRFPKDYRGWVYIYCTKDNKQRLYHVALLDKSNHVFKRAYREDKIDNRTNYLNGKVVARFYCDNVEEIKFINPNRTCGFSCEISDNDCYYNINENECCLSQDDLYDYLQGKNGKDINITNLEIFDIPKELSEFQGMCTNWCELKRLHFCKHIPNCNIPLKKAPQSWCYVETDY